MNVLVTGGNGYVGQETVKELLKQGHKPIILDNLSAGNSINDNLKCPFIEGDIREINIVNILEYYKIDAVIHLAALASVPGSISRPVDYYDVNVVGTFRLLQAMNRSGVARIVFATTGAINSNTPYGHTKLACELMIKDMLPKGVILRYFNVAGGNDHSQEHVLPRILKSTIYHPFIITGDDYPTRDGTCERDYVDVRDVAKANCLSLTSPAGTYEVGTSVGITVYELLKYCKKIQKNIWFDYGDRRNGDETSLVADHSKWLPDWKPQHSLEDIIRSTL